VKEKEPYKKYKMSEYQLRQLRDTNPNVYLYATPFIGTEDIRQYLYCKRKLYFRYVLRAPMPPTYKMEFGKEKHEHIEKIKNKKNFSEKYAHRYYNVYLNDPELGLVGLIDFFEYDGKEAYPVEFKTGNMPSEGLDNPDKYQAIAQAILIEKNFDFLVNRVRVYYIKYDKFVDYYIDVEERLRVMQILREIKAMLESEIMPDPIKEEKKCSDCECRNYCLRV